VTAAAYGATDLTPDEVDDSDESCRVVIRTLWDRAGRRDRLLWQADPRPLFQPIPGATPTKARWSVT
jgi:hypothetical protein